MDKRKEERRRKKMSQKNTSRWWEFFSVVLGRGKKKKEKKDLSVVGTSFPVVRKAIQSLASPLWCFFVGRQFTFVAAAGDERFFSLNAVTHTGNSISSSHSPTNSLSSRPFFS